MPQASLSAKARLDLSAITDHIASDNRTAAKRFSAQLLEKFSLYAERPAIGRPRPELRDDLRSFPYGSYVVYFTPMADGIRIERILHAARDVLAEFIP